MNIIFSEVKNEIDLNESFELRKQVFIVEQGCPIEEEFDEFDDLNRMGNCLLYTSPSPRDRG